MPTFTSDALTFQVTEHGPKTGEPIVLLHGFPQDATSWSATAAELAGGGHRVLTPNLRGYSPGACPRDRSSYGVNRLVGDVLALLDAQALEQAHIVGHDWGGSLVWTMRKTHPHRMTSATIVSTPHPSALAWACTHTGQLLRSWYMAAIALPVLPEFVVRHHLAQLIAATGLPDERASYYQSLMNQKGIATGALNWYRQMLVEQIRPPARPIPPVGAHTPATQYIWGNEDLFFNRAVAERTTKVVSDLSFTELDGGHWLPETHPTELAETIRSHVIVSAHH
ncbi:alpha/beta fold hydrolase [Gordonia rhizosphera]|uniref:Putative hydrolase n=1 Tax=Gordonia rhizosphera NBRC 16068 TaxID=1108045 RepID=K6VML1_9ACTN|nr:alpha/beta fold hydrolase [Gordonia rhizosphera]GAB88140.1 putative hydrolase [Gordonia rhizosphera NBRC 16068]